MSPGTVAYFFYRESEAEESTYAQMGGRSSSEEFQAAYWRSLAVSLQTCRWLNPNINFALYLNRADLPVVDRVPLHDLLEELHVEARVIPWQRRPPAKLATWGCQLFQLDVFEHLSQTERGPCLFLDLDTVWCRSVASLWEAVEQYGLVTYDLQAGIDDDYNERSRTIAEILQRYHPSFHDDRVVFAGGEFLAATPAVLRDIAAGISELWPRVFEDMAQGILTFSREDHFLSAVYALMGNANNVGNHFIRRIWTGYNCFDARIGDSDLMIWHLPTEKGLGFRKMFRDIERGRVPAVNTDGYSSYLGRTMGVPRRRVSKLIRDWTTAPSIPKNLVKRRLLSALSSDDSRGRMT
jgi:hypothetical protein